MPPPIQLPAHIEANLVNGITTAKRMLSVLDSLEQCGKDCQYSRQYYADVVTRAQALLDRFGAEAVARKAHDQ